MRNFKDIVHEYSEVLYWHIRRIVVSHEDAQDVLQETFIKAYKRLWTLRNPDAMKTWLYRIATNESMRFLGKRRNEEYITEKLLETLESSSYVDFTKEAEIKLQKALLQLTPMQRSVFCLKYYDEMDYGQIAEVCKSSENSVKVLYHNAKTKITQYIEL